MNTFSIIIPVFNSHLLSHQLETFMMQTYSKKNFEIIIIDDGSDELYQNTYQKIIAEFSKILSISYHYMGNKEERFRVSAARNIGTSIANYEYMVFIDQDCLVPEYYLEHLDSYTRDSGISEIILGESVGYNYYKDTPTILEDDIVEKKYNIYLDDSRYEDFRNSGVYTHLWEVYIGGNSCIKKSVFEDIRGFDESLISWGGEDIDLGFRLFTRGYHISFQKNIEVYNIKNGERMSKEKFGSFMNNQRYLLEKHSQSEDYEEFIKNFYLNTQVNYKLGLQPQEISEKIFNKRNILLFCSSRYGRGHLLGMVKLYRLLSQRYNVRLVIEGKISQNFLTDIDFLYIQQGDFTGSDPYTIADTFFRDFLPDYTFIDFFPFAKFALKPDIDFLIWMTKEHGGKVFTCMRDLYDGQRLQEVSDIHRDMKKMYLDDDFRNVELFAYEKGEEKYLSKLIISDYIEQGKLDTICIFGDQDIFDISKDEYAFPKHIEKNISYLGYLLEGEPSKGEKEYNHTIVVATGGSFFNKKQYIKLLTILKHFDTLTIDFFPGDDLSSQDLNALSQLIEGESNIRIHTFSREYYTYIQQADIAFICGGYNSFCDMIQFKKYCAVMNYDSDQPGHSINIGQTNTRLSRFERFGTFHDFSSFNASKIIKFIQNFYTGPSSNRWADSFKIQTCTKEKLYDFLSKYDEK